MPLDLDNGDPELADASPAERRRAAARAADEEAAKATRSGSQPRRKTSSTRSKSATAAKEEAELDSRLERTLGRIATMLQQRGDQELASAIQEDIGPVSQGLISLTRSVKLLRPPLLMSLNLIEPVLAFGRIARILYGRFVERQHRVALERQEAEQGAADPSRVTATQ